MRINFWLKAWNDRNIGFHQADFHPALDRHWPKLEPGSSVLVPLCGKSRDLLWLVRQGLDVIGVEFVESAVEEFFRDSGLEFDRTTEFGHPCYRARDCRLRIFATDFIRFADDYGGPRLDSLYDRAALVALPADMRGAYVEACRKLLSEQPRGLLITMRYEPGSMEGPPFSVEPAEVERLWQDRLSCVDTADILASMPRAVAAGVQRLDEYIWTFS